MSDDAVTVVTCPFCAEEIRAQAIKCKHCHEAIPKEDEKDKSNGKKKKDEKQEQIVASIYPAWHAFAWHIFLGILLMPLFGLGLILLIRTVFKRHSTKYVLMATKIVVHKGFLTRSTESFNYNKISSMSFKQTPVQRIFRSGDVLLTLPGLKITVDSIHQPQQFVETINKYK